MKLKLMSGPTLSICLLSLSALTALQGCGFTESKIPQDSSTSGSSSGDTSSGSGSTTGGGGTGTTSSATFTKVYNQILQPKCLSCHGSGTPNFSSYSSFAGKTSIVVPGNPEQSALYTETASGAMPRGGSALNSDELSLLYTWIKDGAKND
jgi:hypothetical protein